ncbi:MAG: VOC family protein [Enhydrobacter sp.]|nr:VOC family protein [Enhydrobacter sp.]
MAPDSSLTHGIEAATIVPTKLAHIVLRTTDKRALLDWYVAVLGGAIVFENEFIGFMTYDDEHHRVAVIQMPDLKKSEGLAPGLHHVAFTYAGLRDLLATFARLKERGIVPRYCINHGPTTSMYYEDPDGNRVELQIDNFATMAQANDWIRSPAFEENPIGVDFDPDELLARFQAGEPEAVLKKRPDIGPRGLTVR